MSKLNKARPTDKHLTQLINDEVNIFDPLQNANLLEKDEPKVLNQKAGEVNHNIGPAIQADNRKALGYIVFGIAMTILMIMCAIGTLWCRRKYKQYFQETYPARDVPDILSGELYYGMVSNMNDQESSSQYISEEYQKEDINDSKDTNKKRRMKSDRAPGNGSQGVY